MMRTRIGTMVLAALTALASVAARGLHAQQSTSQISGQLSIGYSDVTPWMRSTGARSSTFAIIYDDAAGRSYQVTIDSTLTRAYGGIEAMRGKMVSLRVGPQTRGTVLEATAIMSVADKQRGKPLDRVGYGVPDPYATGNRRVLGLGCSFQGSTDQPWPGSEMSPVFFGPDGIEAFWKENSDNQLNFANSKFLDGFKPLPLPTNRYFPNQLVVYVDSLAQACADLYAGDVNLDQYDIFVIHTSSVPGGFCCQVTADHTPIKINGVKTTKSIVVVPGQTGFPFTNSVSVTGHEMGHSLGLPHSAPENGDTYSSYWDVMSAGLSVDVSGKRVIATQTLAGHKDLLGWIPPARRFVSYGGTNTITLERSALPAANGNYLVAHIPFGSNGAYYTVELRKKAGYDISIPREGVIVNRNDPNGGTGDLLIMDRDGNGNVNDDGAVLVAGQTFFDARNQVAVTVGSVGATSATVTITSGGGTFVDVTRLASNTTIAAGSVSTDSVSVRVDGANASSIAWTASTDRPSLAQDVLAGQNSWLQVLTPSGSGPGQVRFRRNAAGLAPGRYIDSITVRMASLNKAWQHVDTLTVTTPTTLYLGLSKILKRDSSNAALLQDSITVSVSGPGADQAAWNAIATNGGRVSRLVETSGTGTRKLHFSAGPNVNSPPGWYVDTIIVSLTATPAVRAMMIDSIHFVGPVIYSIPVRSRRDSLPAGFQGKRDSVVVGLNSPWNTTGRWSITLSQQAYDTSKHQKHIDIVNHPYDPGIFYGTPQYDVTAGSVAYYTRKAGRLKPGIYVDTIHVRGPFPNPSPAVPTHQGEQLVFDTLVVYAAPVQIVLSTYSTHDTIPLGMSRSTDSVTVQAIGRDSTRFIPVAKRNPSFYFPVFSDVPGAGINYAQIRWNRNTATITAPGVYVDTIVFQTSDGSIKSAPLIDSLVVLPASVLTVSSALRAASADPSAATVPDSVTVGSLATTSATWTARKRKAWTTLTTATGAVGGKVRWTRNPAGLAPGIYIDTISVGAAGFVSAALVDSFTVTGTQINGGKIAKAGFDVDSVGGVLNMEFGVTLSVNVTALGLSLGSYSTLVSWDSTTVKLDSVRAVTGGFAAPTVDLKQGADRVALSATSAGGQSGTVSLARLFYHFNASNVGRQTSITPNFTSATATGGGTDLLSFIVPSATKAQIIPGALRGDVNLDGKITTADALLLVRSLVGLFPPNGSVFTFNPNGDANCSGKNEAVDVQYMLAKIVGLPVGNACVGTVK